MFTRLLNSSHTSPFYYLLVWYVVYYNLARWAHHLKLFTFRVTTHSNASSLLLSPAPFHSAHWPHFLCIHFWHSIHCHPYFNGKNKWGSSFILSGEYNNGYKDETIKTSNPIGKVFSWVCRNYTSSLFSKDKDYTKKGTHGDLSEEDTPVPPDLRNPPPEYNLPTLMPIGKYTASGRMLPSLSY